MIPASARALPFVSLAVAVAFASFGCKRDSTNAGNPQLRADQSVVDFGDATVGQTVDKILTLTNIGSGPLEIRGARVSGRDAHAFVVVTSGGAKVAEGQSLQLLLRYAPASAGVHSAQVLVDSDAENAPELAVLLAGTADAGDPCAGVTCLSPPSGCFQTVGTCQAGTCVYAPKTGVACDDGKACTQSDVCSDDGTCSGTQTCDAPPAPSCVDATTQRDWSAAGMCSATGDCEYVPTDTTCASGCDAATGRCKSSGTTLACGYDHCCAITTAGGVRCWGDNGHGELGDGSGVNQNTPRDVQSLGGTAVSLSVGYDHSCALMSTGTVKCWGSNGHGQLGDGTTTSRAAPVDVIGLSGVTQLASGNHHVCALTDAGGVKCWGWSYHGELGNNGTTQSPTPVDVVGLTSGVASLSTRMNHTCAILSAGGVRCWGQNGDGQLGDASTVDRHTPVDVVGLTSGIEEIANGRYHTCARTSAGGVKCWGQNTYGAVGDGTTTGRTTPVDVMNLGSGVARLGMGHWFSCAVTTGGALKCWGYNSRGELGLGTKSSGKTSPVDVPGMETGVTEISGAGMSACASTTTGVYCWGQNGSGQLGLGNNVETLSPTIVPNAR